jgi:hypothetical protein
MDEEAARVELQGSLERKPIARTLPKKGKLRYMRVFDKAQLSSKNLKGKYE